MTPEEQIKLQEYDKAVKFLDHIHAPAEDENGYEYSLTGRIFSIYKGNKTKELINLINDDNP